MLGQRWKEMTLQWKSPWYAPCSIRDNLQKYGLKEHTTLIRRHRKTFCCLILKLEGTDLLSAAPTAVNEQTKKPAELGAATIHSKSVIWSSLGSHLIAYSHRPEPMHYGLCCEKPE